MPEVNHGSDSDSETEVVDFIDKERLASTAAPVYAIFKECVNEGFRFGLHIAIFDLDDPSRAEHVGTESPEVAVQALLGFIRHHARTQSEKPALAKQ